MGARTTCTLRAVFLTSSPRATGRAWSAFTRRSVGVEPLERSSLSRRTSPRLCGLALRFGEQRRAAAAFISESRSRGGRASDADRGLRARSRTLRGAVLLADAPLSLLSLSPSRLSLPFLATFSLAGAVHDRPRLGAAMADPPPYSVEAPLREWREYAVALEHVHAKGTSPSSSRLCSLLTGRKVLTRPRLAQTSRVCLPLPFELPSLDERRELTLLSLRTQRRSCDAGTSSRRARRWRDSSCSTRKTCFDDGCVLPFPVSSCTEAVLNRHRPPERLAEQRRSARHRSGPRRREQEQDACHHGGQARRLGGPARQTPR